MCVGNNSGCRITLFANSSENIERHTLRSCVLYMHTLRSLLVVHDAGNYQYTININIVYFKLPCTHNIFYHVQKIAYRTGAVYVTQTSCAIRLHKEPFCTLFMHYLYTRYFACECFTCTHVTLRASVLLHYLCTRYFARRTRTHVTLRASVLLVHMVRMLLFYLCRLFACIFARRTALLVHTLLCMRVFYLCTRYFVCRTALLVHTLLCEQNL